MIGTLMECVPVDYLDPVLLDDAGRLRAAFSAATFQAFPPEHLKLWCHLRARYVLPTLELVTWLRERIAGRSALEIGAGNGDLGYLAGLLETDSYIQQSPAIRAFYHVTGQQPTKPPVSVQNLDAVAAVMKFRPRVVVAAWFTRKFEQGKDREGVAQASVYGAREEEILERVETYIHIGNLNIHSQKTLLSLPHETIQLSGHLSRAIDPRTNVIHVWNH